MDIKEILKLYKSSMQSELRLIGIESEYPIINNKDFCSCTKKGLKNIFEDFVFQGWAPQYDSQTKKISAVSKKTGNKIKITSDMGVGILEINYAPKENLLEVQKEMEEQIKIISDIISNKNLIMLGYGIQPVSIPGRELVAEKGYYRTLERKFWTTKNSSLVTKNSTDIHYHTISASSQVHISVKNEKEAINVLNNLNIISPIIISLMANSSVWLRGKNIKYNEPRQIFWDWAINTPKDKYRKGIPKKRFRDLEDYIDTQLSFEPIITTRIKDGNIKYFEVVGSQTLRECFQKNQVLITSPGNFNRKLYDKTKNFKKSLEGSKFSIIEPSKREIFALDSSIWYEARLRSEFGTIELRCASQQVPEEQIVLPALTLGLVENIDALSNFANKIKINDARKYRIDSIKYGLNANYNKMPLYEAAQIIFDIAYDGLKQRGLREEIYLELLKKRIKDKENPSDKALKVFKKNGIFGLVELVKF